MASEYAVLGSGLRKAFGKNLAVDDVSVAVLPGEIFGLVGPDGAGKTTTFRLLMGLMTADTGTSELGGFDVLKEPQQARALTGYVAQNFTLYGDLTVMENLRFVADTRSLGLREFRERSDSLLAMTELGAFRDRLARDLSGGMKRKLALACALVHSPSIVLLDEPTTGVDPVSRREFWRMLYGLPQQGVTLVVSTPYMDEAERCHRLGFMAGGKVLALDTPQGLLSHMPDTLVEITIEDRIRARRLLRERDDVRRVETVGSTLRVGLDPSVTAETGAREVADWLVSHGIRPEACAPARVTLQDVFTALSDGAGRAA